MLVVLGFRGHVPRCVRTNGTHPRKHFYSSISQVLPISEPNMQTLMPPTGNYQYARVFARIRPTQRLVSIDTPKLSLKMDNDDFLINGAGISGINAAFPHTIPVSFLPLCYP